MHFVGLALKWLRYFFKKWFDPGTFILNSCTKNVKTLILILVLTLLKFGLITWVNCFHVSKFKAAVRRCSAKQLLQEFVKITGKHFCWKLKDKMEA